MRCYDWRIESSSLCIRKKETAVALRTILSYTTERKAVAFLTLYLKTHVCVVYKYGGKYYYLNKSIFFFNKYNIIFVILYRYFIEYNTLVYYAG